MGVSVTVGDIASVDADVVVVSANTTLDFEGGGARALAAACGPALAVELAAARAQRTVLVGDVITTGAGHHPRLRRILWAVIRDYGATPVEDDAAAVLEALEKVWTIVATAKRLARVAIVPLAAVELGAATSAVLIARSLKAARLPAGRAEVTIVTIRREDLEPMRQALGTRAPGAAASPTPSPPPSPSPAPPPSRPPPPAPSPATSKRQVVGSAVVETFDRCSGVAPVGCAGVLFRVRRSDGPSHFTPMLHGSGTFADIAVDAVPVATHVGIREGEHLLTCTMHVEGAAFWFVGSLRGIQTIDTSTGAKLTTRAPPAGWRQPDFDDSDWIALARTSTPRLELPPGVTAGGSVWLRWPFTLRRTAG